LTILRLGWRAFHHAPALPDHMPIWEQRLAHLGHFGLYGLLAAMPVVGWAIVSTSRFNLPTVLFGLLPLPHLEFLAEWGDKAALHKIFEESHEIGAWLMLALLIGHVAAALRHQYILKDGVLGRMIPFLTLLFFLVPSSSKAAEWTMDEGKSRLGFVGSQSGSAFEGKFSHWTAKIDFDPANPSVGSAVITIDMGSAATGDKQKDLSLPQVEWFDIKHFPQAVFEAKGFRPKGGSAFEAPGSLTIRGHGKDVVLPFTLDITGQTAHAKGRLDLIRTEFGVGQGEWSTAQYVALDVAVTFDLFAVRKN
jgi:polyisoprenoid-binding protein YceI